MSFGHDWPMVELNGTIQVFQDRKWFGDPRLGAFVVYIDGKRAGVARVSGHMTSQVASGRHSVRIRQWWYRSPSFEVNVVGDENVRLRADIPRSIGFARGMARAILRPSSLLVLESA